MNIALVHLVISLCISFSVHHIHSKRIQFARLPVDIEHLKPANAPGLFDIQRAFVQQVGHLDEMASSLAYSIVHKADAAYVSDATAIELLCRPRAFLEAVNNSKTMESIDDEGLFTLYEEINHPIPIIMFRRFSLYPTLLIFLKYFGLVFALQIIAHVLLLL